MPSWTLWRRSASRISTCPTQHPNSGRRSERRSREVNNAPDPKPVFLHRQENCFTAKSLNKPLEFHSLSVLSSTQERLTIQHRTGRSVLVLISLNMLSSVMFTHERFPP